MMGQTVFSKLYPSPAQRRWLQTEEVKSTMANEPLLQ